MIKYEKERKVFGERERDTLWCVYVALNSTENHTLGTVTLLTRYKEITQLEMG